MRIRIATFTSDQNRNMSGYQLTYCSPGISDSQRSILSKWSPSHDGLANRAEVAESFNFFRCDNDFAFSRSFFGGPEYSERGGLKVISHIYLLNDYQFAKFDYQPTKVFHLALSSGHWHLGTNHQTQDDLRRDGLISFPDHTLLSTLGSDQVDLGVVARIVQMAERDHQVALSGLNEPINWIAAVNQVTNRAQRLEYTFTTGLRPSKTRPFKFHFFESISPKIRQDLARQKIPLVELN